ncbi:MAG: GNAT family N-acetyltransferase [Myxacorys chilensis ATA2-1-KO14]|jgi:ribosomal-protein-alanine N-acetyltransferase|nr:GNAT family N-acetyltransferase [Myxacorys chilensis ATA2-1-KO14]
MKILETNRLVLRHQVLGDIDRLYEIYQDPEVTRFIPDAPQTYQETKEELEWFLNGHPKYPQLGLWATLDKKTNQFIGRCGLLPWTIEGREEVEIAYLLSKAYWGRGLGTEVAQGVMQYAFEHLHLTRLICLIDPANQASIRVVCKLGMEFEKEFEHEYGRCLIYAI